MKRILIVTDNGIQYKRFKAFFESYKKQKIQVEFRRTRNINNTNYVGELKELKSINVKNDTELILKNFDFVFSLHCKQIFPINLLEQIKCINIHPGYNPINRGWYPQVFAIFNDLPLGVTIHEMDEQIDNGKIIARKIVEYYDFETSKDVYEKLLLAEFDLFVEHFDSIINNTYTTIDPETNGNYFSIKDFKKLCELDLDEKLTCRDLLKKLRALSHYPYYNAFYISDKDGRKVYIRLDIKK